MADFKNRLKELRKETKLKQSEVAEEMGLGRSTYANYEQGTRFPGKENLIAIADYFGVSIDYLLGETDIKISEDKVVEKLADDPDLLDFYNSMKKNGDLKKVFKRTKGLSTKSIKQILEIIKTFEESNNI
ncbi:MAG: helix-turn-helix domain-containing protein [Halanaerobiales bacterium]|nr:helix-turn-helix domain-containing protein [Halanaerobiales bacterium]